MSTAVEVLTDNTDDGLKNSRKGTQTDQTIALLGSAWILRRILEILEDLLPFRLSI